jgi:very-short-patch-repair endonuclease
MVRLLGIQNLPMFFGASKEILIRAGELRNNPTEAEKTLWEILKNKKLNRLKFRRQHPINSFIADFYCHEKKLVIEVDGPIHENINQIEHDNIKDTVFNNLDIKVLRIKNNDIFNDIINVRNRIISFVNH